METMYGNVAVSDNTRNVVLPQIKKTVENIRANNPVKQDNLKKESEYMRQQRIRERQGSISQGYRKSNWEQQQSQQKMQQQAEAERQAKERAAAEAVVSGAMRAMSYLFPSNYIGALTTDNANGFAERLMYVGDKRNQGLFENNTFLSDSDKAGLNLAFDFVAPVSISKAINAGTKFGKNAMIAKDINNIIDIQTGAKPEAVPFWKYWEKPASLARQKAKQESFAHSIANEQNAEVLKNDGLVGPGRMLHQSKTMPGNTIVPNRVSESTFGQRAYGDNYIKDKVWWNYETPFYSNWKHLNTVSVPYNESVFVQPANHVNKSTFISDALNLDESAIRSFVDPTTNWQIPQSHSIYVNTGQMLNNVNKF